MTTGRKRRVRKGLLHQYLVEGYTPMTDLLTLDPSSKTPLPGTTISCRPILEHMSFRGHCIPIHNRVSLAAMLSILGGQEQDEMQEAWLEKNMAEGLWRCRKFWFLNCS